MELLDSLGIDLSTIWIHALCFGIAYLALTNLVFKPYGDALRAREGKTVGGEGQTQALLLQSEEYASQYEQKARQVASIIKEEYENGRKAAHRETEKLISTARAEASSLLEASRAAIAKEITAAKDSLSVEVPAVAATITSKLAGKEISL